MSSTTLVATSPHEMATAQHGLIDWCDAKLNECQAELSAANGVVTEMRKAGLSDARGRRLITSVRRRAAFYAKVRAALAAGYYVLPPFPVEIFAIRVKEDSIPGTDIRERKLPIEFNPDVLPPGEGEYVNPKPDRVYHSSGKKLDYDKKEVPVKYFDNADTWKEVEFPVTVVRPELIEATGKALALKVFDKLGLFRRQRDPLIVGQIVHYKKYHDPLTFFVAWWVDTKDL